MPKIPYNQNPQKTSIRINPHYKPFNFKEMKKSYLFFDWLDFDPPDNVLQIAVLPISSLIFIPESLLRIILLPEEELSNLVSAILIT